MALSRDEVVAKLSGAGFVNPSGEADLLLGSARRNGVDVEELLDRRLTGEPLPWIAGSTLFCGYEIAVRPGVFVPRPQTEQLAMRAAELLPPHGIALDLCTGSGAVAVVLSRARPEATVVATDMDPAAVACARQNGVDALTGDLDEPVPPSLLARVDVVVAVVPYVPSDELRLLPRDVLAFEPRTSLDGGARGTDVLRRAVGAARRWLRPGGAVLLELGGDEGVEISELLGVSGFGSVRLRRDEDGQVRFVEAIRQADAPR